MKATFADIDLFKQQKRTTHATATEQIVSNTPDELKKMDAAMAAVPAKYGDPKTSGLVNTVEKDGKNFFEIELK